MDGRVDGNNVRYKSIQPHRWISTFFFIQITRIRYFNLVAQTSPLVNTVSNGVPFFFFFPPPSSPYPTFRHYLLTNNIFAPTIRISRNEILMFIFASPGNFSLVKSASTRGAHRAMLRYEAVESLSILARLLSSYTTNSKR